MAIEIPGTLPCAFCEYLSGSRECAFIHQASNWSSFVNMRQYQKGALLIIPNRHLPTTLDLDDGTISSLYSAARDHAAAVIKAFGAVGVNVFQNNGISAGQTVPHFHIHVVPRYGSNDPGKIFREGSFDPVSLDECFRISEQIRSAGIYKR
jgi:histidine triad (HIT) family protein